MELSPVLVWLVVLVLALQVVEFGLRAGRAVLRRWTGHHEPDHRARVLAMSPLEKIEVFRLDRLDEEAQALFLAAVDLPAEERNRIQSLLRLGWNGRRPTAAPAAAASSSEAPAEAPTAEVLALPLKAVPAKVGGPGAMGSDRR